MVLEMRRVLRLVRTWVHGVGYPLRFDPMHPLGSHGLMSGGLSPVKNSLNTA